MQRRALIIMILLSVAIIVTPGCRSRRKVSAPQTAPPAATSLPPAVPVPAPDTSFTPPPADPDEVPRDLDEANRVARQRGWIQDAFFAFDSSNLSMEAQQALRQSASWLRDHRDFGVLIEGHCDERGTEQYNLALGERRAAAAATYLRTLGVDRDRIRTVSYGEERPFVDESNESAWAQNRRAHLVLIRR